MTNDLRSSVRLEVSEARAQITVVVNAAQHPAILVDVSAGGFGVLVLKGVPLSAGQVLTIITAADVFEGEIMHIRPDEAFQVVGLKRMAELTTVEQPKVRAQQSFSKDGIGFSNPLVFIGVALGFAGVMIGVVSALGIDGARGGKPKKARATVTNVRDLDAGSATTSVENLQSQAASVGRASSNQAAILVTGSTAISWDKLVTELNLTASQQEQIRVLASKTTTARTEVLALLTNDQRARFSRLVEGKPPA